MTATDEIRVVDPVLADGLHFDVPFADYLRWPILSQSVLKQGRASPAHLKAAWDGERVIVPTDDMTLGSAFHCAFLEPEAMPEHVILWKGGTRRGATWDEFKAEHCDKAILTPGYYAHLVGMCKSARKHPFVRKWHASIEATEVVSIGTVNGVRMKGRCDALTSEPLIDMKKVASADERLICKTIWSYGYQIQAAIYLELFNRKRFVLLCVEGQPPYDVVPFELSPAWLTLGKIEARKLLDRYKECLATGVWPGRSDDVVMLEPPEWAGEPCSVTVDGTAAFSE